MNSAHVRRRRRKLPNGVGAVLVLAFLAFEPRVLAQYSAQEYEIKAACLIHFAQFVKWPKALPEGQPSIGILGEDPFGGALERLGQMNVGRSQRLDDLKGCQILFISRSERSGIGEILAGLRGTNVLTVSDMDDFARKGGIIGVLIEGGKVHFEINPDAGQRAGLEISSKLLRLGKIVNSG